MTFHPTRSANWLYCKVEYLGLVTSFRWRRGEIDYRRIRAAARKRFLEWVVSR
jgi:hypothetical protein